MEIKKELEINASSSRVYNAITDMKQLSQWFPDVVSLDPRLGGKIVFQFPTSILSESFDTIEGTITELEKNKKLTYTWSHPNVPDFPMTKVSWNLERVAKNKTKVIIIHSGFVNESTMNSYNKKWLWITEHLNSFTVSENPVNVGDQIKSLFIPGADSKAFYRIKKTRKAMLYITVPVIVTTVAMLLMISFNVNDYTNDIIDYEQFSETIRFTISGFVPIFVVITLSGIFLMRKWTIEWNQQFLIPKKE